MYICVYINPRIKYQHDWIDVLLKLFRYFTVLWLLARMFAQSNQYITFIYSQAFCGQTHHPCIVVDWNYKRNQICVFRHRLDIGKYRNIHMSRYRKCVHLKQAQNKIRFIISASNVRPNNWPQMLYKIGNTSGASKSSNWLNFRDMCVAFFTNLSENKAFMTHIEEEDN